MPRDRADREAAKVRRLVAEAIRKVNWQKHGLKLISDGSRSAYGAQIRGPYADVQIDLTPSYSPRYWDPEPDRGR